MAGVLFWWLCRTFIALQVVLRDNMFIVFKFFVTIFLSLKGDVAWPTLLLPLQINICNSATQKPSKIQLSINKFGTFSKDQMFLGNCILVYTFGKKKNFLNIPCLLLLSKPFT